MSKDKKKELKYQIYLIDQEIKDLKKQKKIYVDELKKYDPKNKKAICTKNHIKK